MLSKPLVCFLKEKGLVLEEEQSQAAEESWWLSAGKRGGAQRPEGGHWVRRCSHSAPSTASGLRPNTPALLFVLFAVLDKLIFVSLGIFVTFLYSEEN